MLPNIFYDQILSSHCRLSVTYVAIVVARNRFVSSVLANRIVAVTVGRDGRVSRGRQHIFQGLDILNSVSQNLYFR